MIYKKKFVMWIVQRRGAATDRVVPSVAAPPAFFVRRPGVEAATAVPTLRRPARK